MTGKAPLGFRVNLAESSVHADPSSSGECRSKCILDTFSASIEALPKGGLMSGPIGQRLVERNVAEPPPWGVNYVPFSQGRTLQ
jgi:hypothetical protein